MTPIKPSTTSFSLKPRLIQNKNTLTSGRNTVVAYLFTIFVLVHIINCMDSLPSQQKIKFENVYLKFETNVRHGSNTYGIELFIPYNYIMLVSHMVFSYHSYLQTIPFKKKVVVSLKRKDGERIETYFNDLPGNMPGTGLLQTITSDIESLIVVILQHIDDYLVPYINLEEHLNDMKPRFASIEGIWKKEFPWATENLKEMTFSGIYQTYAYHYLDDTSTGILAFVAFDQKLEITKVGGENEFQIIYNLLEAVHKDLFKNKKLNHYQFILTRIVQQGFESSIIIHKKCINVLRLFDNEQKDTDILTMDMNPVDIFLPYMCYFSLLGTILSRFRASLFIEDFKDSLNNLSLLINEYLTIASPLNKKGNLFVRVKKRMITPIVKNFLKEDWRDINTCKIVEVESCVVLDSYAFNDVNDKIYGIIIEVFDLIVSSTDKIKEFLYKTRGNKNK